MERVQDTKKTRLLRIGAVIWNPRNSLICLYLGAIIAANLIINKMGLAYAIPVAFVFIGLDLTARDRLHDLWAGRSLSLRMGLLIVSGSFLSWVLNRESGHIAFASVVSFTAAAVIDSIFYFLLRDRSRFVRVNGSNVFSAAADSLLFPWLAAGHFMPVVSAGQFIAKVAGGFVWLYLLMFLGTVARMIQFYIYERTGKTYHETIQEAPGTAKKKDLGLWHYLHWRSTASLVDTPPAEPAPVDPANKCQWTGCSDPGRYLWAGERLCKAHVILSSNLEEFEMKKDFQRALLDHQKKLYDSLNHPVGDVDAEAKTS